jgi:hypothetical protein
VGTKVRRLIRIVLLLLLVIYLLYLIILFFFAQFFVIVPGVTIYTDSVYTNSIPLTTGCFNKCSGESNLIFCGREDTELKEFGKQCHYLCLGSFYNNCWK